MSSNYYKNWMEIWFLVLFLLGLLTALFAPSAAISYVVITLAGIGAGRLIYERRHSIKFPYLVIVLGFFIGYLMGVYYGNRFWTSILFVAGFILGYKFFEKGILKDIRF